jgi:hypothetical protein
MDTVSEVEYLDSDTDRCKPPLNEFGLEYGRKISILFSSLVLVDEIELGAADGCYYRSMVLRNNYKLYI